MQHARTQLICTQTHSRSHTHTHAAYQYMHAQKSAYAHFHIFLRYENNYLEDMREKCNVTNIQM